MSHAVIMGGSIAGLCAAAALARNFDQVTVLERDNSPQAEARRGVPQGQHVHALLSRGQEIMSRLCPGAFDALERAGAVRVDLGSGVRWFQFGSWKCRSHVGVDMWMQTRPMLEHCVRQSVAEMDNVELRFECPIDAPVYEHGRVCGVKLRDGSVIEADVVIDATGRGSRSTKWLEQWGHGRAKEQRVELNLAYVSGTFELPEGEHPEQALGVYHMPPHNRRCGWVFPVEGRRVVVTLVGYHGDHPPHEEHELVQWARGMMRSDLANLLDRAKLVGELSRFGCREQVRRKMPRMPQGYLVLGDALCTVDPTFGQGMTVVAMQAERLLALRPGMSTRRFQRQIERLTKVPFTITANEAHRWREVSGWQPAFGAVQRWYMGRVFDAAASNPAVHRRFIRVLHFKDSPAVLFAPAVLGGLLFQSFRENRRSLPSTRAPSVEPSLTSPLHQTGY